VRGNTAVVENEHISNLGRHRISHSLLRLIEYSSGFG
jgi:hypothetical protein